ncbi:MAG TPA: PfkB family carbohydrate kinase [Candidatus Dormibacteraeota bacterium]|nr:PfkB family carbohydrate kinase [Candidatus Dormibacteraeota bacterium]
MDTRMTAAAQPILVVGSVALDTVHTPTESASEILGGGASYFCLAGSMFAPIRLVAVVGEDFPAADRAMLESRGVDLTGLAVGKGRTFRWTARYSGVRLEERETLDTQLNVFADFHPALPAAYRDSRIVFLSNIQPELQLEVLDQIERTTFVACDTIKLWLDTARPGLERVFRRVDCVLVNDEEAVQFSGQRFLPAAARVILSYGPRCVIIKRGENGSLLFTKDRMFMAPAHPLETVRDPTGAGDAFAGGLIGMIARTGHDRDDVLRRGMLYGSVLGSLAVEDFSVRRIMQADMPQVETRLSTLVDMISLDGARAT